MSPPDAAEQERLAARRTELRDKYVTKAPSHGRGIHHAALICSDVEQTIDFYQGLLGFPLDRAGREPRLPRLDPLLLRPRQQHTARLLRLPRPRLEQLPEGIGGVQHIAISVPPDVHAELQTEARRRRDPVRRPAARHPGVDLPARSRRHRHRAAARRTDVLRREVAQPRRNGRQDSVRARVGRVHADQQHHEQGQIRRTRSAGADRGSSAKYVRDAGSDRLRQRRHSS